MTRFLFLLLAASPTLADCPTRADLATGVTLERFESPFLVTFRVEEGILVEEREMEINGVREARQSTFVHALAVKAQDSATSKVEFSYHADLSPLDHLDELGEFAAATTLSVNGVKRADGSYRIFYEGSDRIAVGDCEYDIWQVTNEVLLDDFEPMFFWWDYAPDLGLIVQTAQVDANGNPLGTVYYDTIRKAGK